MSDAPLQEQPDPQTDSRSDTARRVAATAKRLSNPWFLAVLLIAGLSTWQWFSSRQQLTQQQTLWEKQLAEFDGLSKEGRIQLKQALEQNASLQGRLTTLEGRLETFEEQSSGLLSAYRDINANRDLALLVEAEHALVLAAQQLQVTGDTTACSQTLQAIDQRLTRLDLPHLANIRKSLARDLENLKKAPALDRHGMGQRLEAIMVNVEALPLLMEARPTATSHSKPSRTSDESFWDRITHSIWLEVKGLIRIERVDNVTPVLLPANQRFFITENIKLRLLSARVALLSRDQVTFRQALQIALDLLERHFSTPDRGVQNTLNTLRQMQSTPIAQELPTLTESISSLRQAQRILEKKK